MASRNGYCCLLLNPMLKMFQGAVQVITWFQMFYESFVQFLFYGSIRNYYKGKYNQTRIKIHINPRCTISFLEMIKMKKKWDDSSSMAPNTSELVSREGESNCFFLAIIICAISTLKPFPRLPNYNTTKRFQRSWSIALLVRP